MGLDGPMRSTYLTSVKVGKMIVRCANVDVYTLSAGVWFFPVVRGTRPPPCAAFTLTSVDNHQAIVFGGFHPECGNISDLYLIDFSTMVSSFYKDKYCLWGYIHVALAA